MLPHLGASTREANHKAAELAARELIDLDDHGVTKAVVNRAIPMGLDPAFARLATAVARLCRALLPANAAPRLAEARIYGELKPYADWLVTPIATALVPGLDPSLDRRMTVAALAEKGIDYLDRPVDEKKKYTSSITLDITANVGGTSATEAVRGTVEEGNVLISRINAFDKLYVEPKGNFALFTYDDRPGVLGKIAAAVAQAGLNIEDVRSPLNPADNTSLALLKLSSPASDALIAQIAASISARHALHIEF